MENKVYQIYSFCFQKLLKMSKKTKKEISINLIASLVCTSGLIYQSMDLLFQYLTGKTVVNMEVGQIFNDTLPAITICYPFVLSMENAVNGSQEQSEWRREYLDIEEVIGSLNQTLKEKNLLKMEDLYHKFSRDYFATKHGIHIDKTFAKSIPYMHNGDAAFEVIEFSGVARHLDKNDSHKIINEGNDFQDELTVPSKNQEPIESVLLDNGVLNTFKNPLNKNGMKSFNQNNQRKCFTMFSALDKTFRKTRIDLEEFWFLPRYNIVVNNTV